jgi:hypothetical protein
MRGTKNPLLVLETSSTAEGSGLLLPIPICARENVVVSRNKQTVIIVHYCRHTYRLLIHRSENEGVDATAFVGAKHKAD